MKYPRPPIDTWYNCDQLESLKEYLDTLNIEYSLPGYDASKTAVCQELIKYIAVWSNLNVDLQQYVMNSTVAVRFRLFCRVCKAAKQIDYDQFVLAKIDDIEFVLKPLESFCTAHKHLVKKVEPKPKPLLDPEDHPIHNIANNPKAASVNPPISPPVNPFMEPLLVYTEFRGRKFR